MEKKISPKREGLCFFRIIKGFMTYSQLLMPARVRFRWWQKKEVANVPLLKQTFKCMKAYMIDREDIRQSMQVIMDVTEEVKKGRNYLIFAEGTRSKMGNKLLEFKGGSFKAATKAKCPIIPIALIDSFKPFDTNSIAPVTVQVHFLEPIYYEEYQNMKTTEIAKEVKRRIEETISEYEPKEA